MRDVVEDLSTPEQTKAAARSHGYRVLVAAFTYPEGEMCEAIRSREIAQALEAAVCAVDPALGTDVEWDALSDAGEDDDLAVEFTRLFDVGASGPPCPLNGGLYGGARMKVMEEAVRFYNHFGLNLDEAQRELPDHLQTELEFIHYLAFRETESLVAGEDPGPYRRAQRDFLARHPGRFVPRLQERLEEQKPMPYFRALVGLLANFLVHDLRHLVALTLETPGTPSREAGHQDTDPPSPPPDPMTV